MLFPQRALWVTLLLWLQVKDLTKYLDPSGLGVISFEDFHRGIRAIRNGGEFAAVLRVRAGGHRISHHGVMELRGHLVKTSWVWCPESHSSVLGRGWVCLLIELKTVVMAVCFPIYQGSSVLNVYWKQEKPSRDDPFWFGVCSPLWFW